MSKIHPSAVVDKDAEIAENVQIGPYAIIEKGVKIGERTTIASHAVVAEGASIGKNCRIFSGAVIATVPQDLKFGNEKTFVEIGDNTTIREYATVNRATTHSYYTRVGSNCLLMAYSHIAHDCQIGNNVVIANAVNMGGHVIIADNVGIGGLTAIHQFVKIGEQCFVGGGLRVNKDIPPFVLAMGEPITFGGLNAIGLKRRGFSDTTLQVLKHAYKIIYRSGLTTGQALKKIEEQSDSIPEIETIVSFIRESERGIIR
ncbi:MAG: acyl-ACP--UDP-N-acetylglucosamine O-acyltransferase [Caldithrix sp.]|nr:acyl-ACP--UDP-N-acetylglucosamine O-acyltransferase [Caldithrix sp.]